MKKTLKPKEKSTFRKDFKWVLSQGKDYQKYRLVLVSLLNQEPLDASLEDHPLKGKWRKHRELHIEPDWLLIYRITEEYLILARTGSHSDLF